MLGRRTFAVVAVCLLAYGCKGDQPSEQGSLENRAGAAGKTAPGSAKAPPTPASAVQQTSPPVPGWSERTNTSGGFKVIAPTDGVATEGTTPTPAGPAKTVSMLFQSEGSPGALMVMYMDMPVPPGTPLAVARGLEDGRDRAVRHYSGTLTSDREITVDGYPAREFEFDATLPNLGAAKAMMRGVFRDNRIYMIAGITRVGADEFRARAAEFVRSFTILPPARATP